MMKARTLLFLLAAVGPLACGDDAEETTTNAEAGAPPPTQDAGADADAALPSVGAIRVLSNRADLVSDGDALVQVVPSAGIDVTKVTVDIGGVDATSAFAARSDGRYLGVVTGLANGANLLTAKAPGASPASLTITNHSQSGAILYGPQIGPWGCDPGATDAQCNRPVSYAYQYQSTDPTKTTLLPYDPMNPATDVAMTTTDSGQTVPFVVRIETLVQDRDYVDIAVLFDASKPWTRWDPQPAWNHKVLVEHGSGCGNAYAQSNVLSAQRVLDTYALSHGFAVLAISLNDAGHNCNIAVEAEATMMAKEHVIEAYGDLRYLFGYGTSGGALAQQWMANVYPGLYDGIIAGLAFPDAGSTLLEVEDCSLLERYFANPAVAWTSDAQAAASGHLNTLVCNEWTNVYGFYNNLNPSASNVVAIPGTSPTALGGCDATNKYDPLTNPTGTRCDIQDSAISIFGKRPDGFAGRPYSNIGVQYGMNALVAGTISTDQFVDLNAKIGSHTIDYVPQTARVAADPGSIAASYRSGFFNEANGMASVAIIHIRPLDITGIHHQYRSWAMRARLDRANGGHGNQAIWYQAGSQNESYDVMDAWLTATTTDTSNKTLAAKIVADRPATANDRCSTADGTGLSMVQCTGAADGSTRMGAGGDITDDVLECTLKPLDRGSYGTVVFTDAEWATMQATFPSGVCDYTKPGGSQQTTQLWQSYLKPDGSVVVGGFALPAAP